MSDGLKLISAIISSGSAGVLAETEREALIENEVSAFDFVKSHYRSYRELPSVQTVFEETGIRLPTPRESVSYYADQVGERFDYNRIRDRFAGFREGLTQKNMTVVADVVHDMSRVLRRRRGPSRAGQLMQINEGLELVSQRLLDITGTGGISGITTGWNLFDSITGGYQNADLITWVGRMGMGKTYVALRQAQMAHDAGESVLFVTTEMGIEQIARRYAALALGVNPTLLKNGMVSTYIQNRIRDLCRSMQGSERFKLFSVGMGSKVSAIEALIQEFGPTVCFIDGIYLLRPTEAGRNMNRTERITAVYDEVKTLTLESNIPFVAFSQLNRAAGKSGADASLETIGFSDAIGTHSSIVVAIKHGKTENPKDSRIFDFLKGREGESGEVAINFKFAPLDMNEMTQEDREEAVGVTEESVAWMGPRRRAPDGE